MGKKVQELTIELDELHYKLYRPSHSATSSYASNRSISQRTMICYDHDEEKKNEKRKNKSVAMLKSPEIKHDDICKVKFDRWLCEVVKLGQYLSAFKEKECDDIRMIEFFEDDAIEKEIGIKQTFHRKLIMKKAREFKNAQNNFTKLLDNKGYNELKETLEMHG